MKEFRNPEDVHPPVAAYTHQIEIMPAERLLVLSGQVGRKLDGTIPDDPLEQLDIALENLLRNVKAANMELEDIVKITFYLVGSMDAAQRGAVITSKLQGHKPCMTLLYVTALASPVYRVEIDAWASRSI